ncbi:hypothetical protein [Nitrogeniibacter aestuarii]|uniref:hypothetical protein n=1 Tax=Nitrogeniibacter aestuarii TaxID=2815343 RepID=UPI001D12BE44|nr:hypothetical protein [Nitrogeniibacter aestuarii]
MHQPTEHKHLSPREIAEFFQRSGKFVLTFTGYSGSGYEDEEAMLDIAEQVLNQFDPADTLINIGATADGIGAVYLLAKQEGFATTGIVSSQALLSGASLSPCVDDVFYVEDDTWGGCLPESNDLSPTSTAMVAVSHAMIGIGGSVVARDELLAAREAGKPVHFFAADMNHQRAIDNAKRAGAPMPNDFGGAAASVQLNVAAD